MTSRRNILVIKLSALGDMVLALPAFAAIRAAHPDARITLLTTPPYADLARSSPYFDAVETDGRPSGGVGWVALMRRLRRARYDRVYDLQCNDRTNLVFQALRPSPPVWSGVARGCALPHRNRDRLRLHSLDRHAEQLRDAGIVVDPSVTPDVSWMIPQARNIAGARPKALLVPGAAAHRTQKRWAGERYGDLAARLIEGSYDVDILGAVAERPLAQMIRARAPAARDLTGATALVDIAELAAAAALAVGNDTGPMHLIAAAGAPCVVLFGAASDPALSAPRGRVTVVRAESLADVSVEQVWAAARRTL